MRKTSESRRISTEPAIHKLYQKSIKVQGIVYIQAQAEPAKKTAILQVKPDHKLLFHCYRRYKSYPYSFDYVYEESEEIGFYGPNFGEFNAAHSLEGGLDYMLYCIGAMSKLQTRELPVIEMLFYEHLAAIFDTLIKQEQCSMRLNFISISEDTVFDLITQSTVQIRQTPNSDIIFVGSQQIAPTTPYQIYQIIKQTSTKKNKLMINSYYIIYGQILPKQAKKQKRKFIFVNSTKDLNERNRNWDNGSNLVLNKCILGLLNKMEGQNKQAYAPFRDSKITRVIKPFLTYNARVDALGFINLSDEEGPFSTLNLVKNLSRLKIPVSKISSPQNPEITQLQQKLEDLLKEKEKSHTQKNRINSHSKIFSRQNLLQEVRKNAKQQLQIQKNLNKIRSQIRIVRKRKELNLVGLVSMQKSQMMEKLQQQQINMKQQKEKQLIQAFDKINKNRIQTIGKSISKVEKLKLLKQYYTIAILNQKQQVEDFIQQQQVMGKFYEQKLLLIDKDLKKSPKQLLKQNQNSDEKMNQDSGKKRYKSVNTSDIHSLPNIVSRQKKRISYVKQKVKKGRVEYEHFLSKNVENYKSYSTPIKQ